MIEKLGDKECPRCGAFGGFGCYECTPADKVLATMNDLKPCPFCGGQPLGGIKHDKRCLAAADCIEALEAENERLRAEIAERNQMDPRYRSFTKRVLFESFGVPGLTHIDVGLIRRLALGAGLRDPEDVAKTIDENTDTLHVEEFYEKPTGWQPIETAPEYTTVFVAGGIAQKRNGVWFTGMEEPMFQRAIEWPVTVWMPLPAPPKQDAGEVTFRMDGSVEKW